MKHFANTPAYLLIICLLCFAQCKKDKPKTPIEQLPPETQTGANTFGCLVNGEVFKPGGAQLSGGSLTAIYQNIFPNTPSGYIFGVTAKNNREDCLYKTLAFGFDSVVMNIGIYALQQRGNGQGGGAYQLFPCALPTEYFTSQNVVGQLHLKRFDTIQQIASGTFWFKAVNNIGDSVNVTDGRFDVRYTR